MERENRSFRSSIVRVERYGDIACNACKGEDVTLVGLDHVRHESFTGIPVGDQVDFEHLSKLLRRCIKDREAV